MAQWERSTPWRQGAVLTAEAATAFGLASAQPPGGAAVVVISHDCDCAQSAEQEPNVEVIVGRFLDAPHGNYMHCKNLRRLHLRYSAQDGSDQYVELEPQNRTALKKTASGEKAPELAAYSPNPQLTLKPKEHRVLQRWLAARYDRSAFPDEFDRRLDKETGIAEKLAKAFKETGKYIPAIFFDVDQGEEKARSGAGDPYELVVTVLYLTDEDTDAAKNAADEAKKRIIEIFRARCREKNAEGVEEWRWIELQAVEVISDNALTYAQSAVLKRWNADHVSLRADPPQPALQAR
jgi:hypothetical protein